MNNALGLLKHRRFLPLFVTQFLGAFNDNLFKQAMVLVVVYKIYNDPQFEQGFTSLASVFSIVPFVFLSALAGQLADTHDKARITRIVKTVEIGIMLVGGAGLLLAGQGYKYLSLTLMLTAVGALGVHSTFFGPIKYAILPQHLHKDEVLGGTGLVESATYIAILAGTVLAGFLSIELSVVATLLIAAAGWLSARGVPPAPRQGPKLAINYNPITSSWRLVNGTMHVPRLFLAICAISFFWTMGIVLIVTFTPLTKNALTADPHMATILTALFSIGIAVGSVAINTLLKGHASARLGPVTVLTMGVFVIVFALLCQSWPRAHAGQLYDMQQFFAIPHAWPVILSLIGIAVFGGMFVVPLYAFLTTTVTSDETARTVAANNVVNSLAMAVGSAVVALLSYFGVDSAHMLYLVAAMTPASAWIAWKLHKACDGAGQAIRV